MLLTNHQGSGVKQICAQVTDLPFPRTFPHEPMSSHADVNPTPHRAFMTIT